MANTSLLKRTRDSDGVANEDERPAKRARASDDVANESNIDEFDNIVTVLVGREEKRFIIHQDAACAKSKYFKAACSTQWLEGQERIVRLRYADPAVFKAYSTWVYSGELPKTTCTSSSKEHDKSAEKELLIELHILGDKLDDIELRNQAKRMLLESMERQMSLCTPDHVHRIYASTLPGSLLRKMSVATAIGRQVRTNFAEKISENPNEFVQEVAVAALEATSMGTWEELKKQFEQWKEKEPQQ